MTAATPLLPSDPMSSELFDHARELAQSRSWKHSTTEHAHMAAFQYAAVYGKLPTAAELAALDERTRGQVVAELGGELVRPLEQLSPATPRAGSGATPYPMIVIERTKKGPQQNFKAIAPGDLHLRRGRSRRSVVRWLLEQYQDTGWTLVLTDEQRSAIRGVWEG